MGITSFTSASSNNRPVLFWKSVQFTQHSSTLPTRKGLGIDTLKCQKAPKNPKQHFVEYFSSDVLPNREAEDAKKSLASKLYQCSYTVWHPDFILNRITSSLPVTNSCTILIKHYFWKVSQNPTSQGPPPHPWGYMPQACTATKWESSNARGLSGHVHFRARIKHKIGSIALFSTFFQVQLEGHMISCIKGEVSPKGHYSRLLVGQEVQHAADVWQGQTRATRRPSITHLVLTAGQLDHWATKAENRLQLKQRDQMNSSFPMELDSGLLSVITSSPVQETSGPRAPTPGWIYTEIS